MINDIINTAKTKMHKSIETLIEELKNIRSGRVSPSLVEDIVVDYYGNKTPIKQMASISAPEPRLIVIQPWDRNASDEIKKAIQSSDLSITPSDDGKVIRLAFPQLTEEEREHLSKLVHKRGEECKIAIRNIRRDANHEIDKTEKADHISEDDADKGKKDIQKITDDKIKEIDEIIKNKTAEIMEV